MRREQHHPKDVPTLLDDCDRLELEDLAGLVELQQEAYDRIAPYIPMEREYILRVLGFAS